MNDLVKAEIILAGGCNECFQLKDHDRDCSKRQFAGWDSIPGKKSGLAAKELRIIHSGRRSGKSELSRLYAERICQS